MATEIDTSGVAAEMAAYAKSLITERDAAQKRKAALTAINATFFNNFIACLHAGITATVREYDPAPDFVIQGTIKDTDGTYDTHLGNGVLKIGDCELNLQMKSTKYGADEDKPVSPDTVGCDIIVYLESINWHQTYEVQQKNCHFTGDTFQNLIGIGAPKTTLMHDITEIIDEIASKIATELTNGNKRPDKGTQSKAGALTAR